jgi:hypothetical protein
MSTLSKSELVENLLQVRGAKFTTIVSETDPRLKKTDNPYYGTKKIARVNGCINWIYQNAVNNQRMREGQPSDSDGTVEFFTPEPRRWGSRIHGTPLVEHKGHYYLELKVQRSLGYEYRLGAEVIDPSEIEPFIPKKTEGARQKLAKPVILRDYSIISIRQITMDGIVYEIE